LGGRHGRAATLLVLAGLLLLGVPTAMLGTSFATHIHDISVALDTGDLPIEPPPESVAGWPVVGERVYAVWSTAATDLPAYVEENREQLRELIGSAVRIAASTAGAVLLFLGSLVIAGIIMAYGEAGSQALQRIFCRMIDPVRGPRLQRLSTATVRSVATGVVGVAFIQALLLGIGFIVGGVPAAGILALLVLLFGILQLPVVLISLPVIAYIWWAGDGSTVMNAIVTVYLVVAGLADNILKPMLLGRGVDVPMPVVLIGALGGMVMSGIVGLFVGAVVLAVGYEVFMAWVDGSQPESAAGGVSPVTPDDDGPTETG
jgi:predicted PurR-regulated permease PerM